MSGVYLGLDTATPFLALAIWSPQGGTLASRSDLVGRDHARRLMGAIGEMMKELDLPREFIRGVGVGTGPGSYTGLRIGMAAAKGLAQGLGVPLRGAPTLEAIAAGMLAEGQRALATLDAGRERTYCAVYERQAGSITLHGEIARLERQELASFGLPLLAGPPSASYLAQRAYRQPNERLQAYYL